MAGDDSTHAKHEKSYLK